MGGASGQVQSHIDILKWKKQVRYIGWEKCPVEIRSAAHPPAATQAMTPLGIPPTIWRMTKVALSFWKLPPT